MSLHVNVPDILADYYRCPANFEGFVPPGELPEERGYFRFGQDTICYGRLSSGPLAKGPAEDSADAIEGIRADGPAIRLPFDAGEVIENLRRERYAAGCRGDGRIFTETVRKTYYLLRPLAPVAVRKHLQRMCLRGWDKLQFPAWPVDSTVERVHQKLLALSLKARGLTEIPFIWFWPDGFPSCAIMTHDVETSSGRDFCSRLMDVDQAFGIKSAFQLVPESRYSLSQGFLESIRDRGFEINIQDLNHDGHLFANHAEFLRRVGRINGYARHFGAQGFRSAVLYRKADWYDAFDFSYDMSIPNVGHLDPQWGGCCTVMPYFIGRVLELPITTTQDYTLFHILGDYSIELWKRQVGLIMEQHGLVSFVAHPDYLILKQPRATYVALLEYLSQLRSEGKLWMALPREVDDWWRERSQMRLVCEGGTWRVEGPGRERAKIAFATLAGDRVAYTLTQTSQNGCSPRGVGSSTGGRDPRSSTPHLATRWWN